MSFIEQNYSAKLFFCLLTVEVVLVLTAKKKKKETTHRPIGHWQSVACKLVHSNCTARRVSFGIMLPVFDSLHSLL